MVEPVVTTSSRSSNLMPLTSSATSTVPARLAARSAWPSSRWSRARRRTRTSVSGSPVSRQSSRATSSMWSNPRRAKAAAVAGTKQTASTSPAS